MTFFPTEKALNVLPVLVLLKSIGIAVAILFSQNIVTVIAILFISIAKKPGYGVFKCRTGGL